MQLSIQIYNALGEAVTDAALEFQAEDGQGKAISYDAVNQAYTLAYERGQSGCIKARHPNYQIDPVCWTADVPLAGVATMSAGTSQDRFSLYKGQRRFFRELPNSLGVQLHLQTSQDPAAYNRLLALEQELGLERIAFPQPAAAVDPFERMGTQKVAYRYGARLSGSYLIRRLRESELLMGAGPLRADGSIVIPAFSIETGEEGLAWLQQLGFEPEPVAWQPRTYTVALTPEQEADFSRLCEEMLESKYFASFWQNAYP